MARGNSALEGGKPSGTRMAKRSWPLPVSSAASKISASTAPDPRKRRHESKLSSPVKISLCGFDLAEAEGICGAANGVSRVNVDTVGELLDPLASHVVMAPMKAGETTVPLRVCMAAMRGLWILEPAWVYRSLEEGTWLEEEKFEVRQPSSIRRARLAVREGKAPPLTSVIVCFWGKTRFAKAQLSTLITTAGGQVVSSYRMCNALLVDDATPLPQALQVQEQSALTGVRIVDSTWLFETILPPDAPDLEVADAGTSHFLEGTRSTATAFARSSTVQNGVRVEGRATEPRRSCDPSCTAAEDSDGASASSEY